MKNRNMLSNLSKSSPRPVEMARALYVVPQLEGLGPWSYSTGIKLYSNTLLNPLFDPRMNEGR